uniref:Uncharacterized protein n=1 Tax=Avena sativa TaxID=4498 RepID=A0ACD5VMI6_AVESA
MHRSSSYYLSSSSSSSASSSAAAASVPGGPSGNAGVDVDQLPTYNPQSDAAKKEALDASRANLAHALVHLVPIVVLLCGLLLWSLSTTLVPPAAAEVGVIVLKKGRLMALKSELMAAMEDPDPVGKPSHGLASEHDGSTAGKRIKDGLKKRS